MIKKILLSEIKITMDRRPVDEDYVRQLAESIGMIGLLHPITVDFENTLIAGLHRFEACKRLKWETIPCEISFGTELHNNLLKIDENIIRNDLTFYERAEALHYKKLIYEEMYPETKNGGDRRSENFSLQNMQSENNEEEFSESDYINKQNEESQKEIAAADNVRPVSFVESISNMTGESPRSIYDSLSIASGLTDDVKEIIKSLPLADKKSELMQLAKHEPDVQMKIATAIANNEIQKVSEFVVDMNYFNIGRDFDVENIVNDLTNTLNAYRTSKSELCLEIVNKISAYIRMYKK